MSGPVFSTFLVVFREALEAGLILGIILTVLVRLDARRYIAPVLASSAAALAASLAAGAWLASLAGTAQDRAQEILEGGISLVAAAVLTYMFFWMERQSRDLKRSIEGRVRHALDARDVFAIVSLPFFAVFREGAETVLFLKAVSLQSGGSVSAAGGAAGVGLALAITATIFVGGKRVPLGLLFRVTGILILFMTAGLLAYGVHELEEAGLVHPIVYPVWNVNHILNEKEGVGSFLKALFGYNGNPSLTEVVLYWSYLVAIGWAVIARRRAG